MDGLARSTYLATDVMTATPQKLQLMLIEGAMRFGRLALLHWEQGRNEQAGEAIIRCQQIIAEMLGGLRPDRDPALVGRVAAIYSFLFRTLSRAHLGKERQAVEDVLRILEIERETWKQVCQQLGSRRDHEMASDTAASFSA